LSGVLGQDPAEVPLAEDQHPVGDLGADGQHEALGEAVRPRATWRVGGDPGDVRDYMLTRLTARLHGPDAWWADV